MQHRPVPGPRGLDGEIVRPPPRALAELDAELIVDQQPLQCPGELRHITRRYEQAADAVLDGFDLGVGILSPYVARSSRERGLVMETIGPVWDGNEVWLLTLGGALFAAFPPVYATVFSGFYLALLLILFFLIVRVVSFEWREKGEGTRWRRVWLLANAGGSTGIALVWGIGLSNLLYGVPIDSDGHYAGTFWDLFSVYTVLGGIAFVLVCAFHGASFLTLRTTGDLCTRARAASSARPPRSRRS